MKRKRNKHILGICFAICLAMLQAVPAFAADIFGFDPARRGTLTVIYRTAGDNTPMAGAEITLYRVGDGTVRADDEQYIFTYTREFIDCRIGLTEPYDAALAEGLSKYAAGRKIAGQTEKTDRDGTVKFEGLTPGLYLVVQTGKAEGFSVCAPFLSCVPTADEREWIYDIDATPKADIRRLTEITVNKVWNDDGKDRPAEVTIQLLHSDKVYDTVKLSESNGWTYTWKSLSEDENWSVQEINVPKGYIATYKQNGMIFTVNNTPALIQTGQLNWPVPVFAGVGLFLVSVGWILIRSGKKEKND